MRILEVVLLCLLVIAVGWFFFLLPGGESLLLIVLNLLALVYFGFGFILFSNVTFLSAFKGGFKNTPTPIIILGAFTGLGLSTMAIGILFKVLMLPGGGSMLLVGGTEALIVLVVNIVYYFKRRHIGSKRSISRLIIFLIPSLLLLTTSSLALVRIQYRNHPAYIKAYTSHLEDPGNQEKWEALDRERIKIDLSQEEFELYEKSQRK